MNINKFVIKEFNPCVDRYKNFLEHYGDQTFSFDEFIELENIAYDDKIWVARRILNQNQLVHFGIMCAESVLGLYQGKYPEDYRVKDCLEHLKDIKAFSTLTETQKEEIWQQRNTPAYAAYAATAAATAAADAAAAYAATERNKARAEQQNLNLHFLKMAASL
jgi:hypothetical protein